MQLLEDTFVLDCRMHFFTAGFDILSTSQLVIQTSSVTVIPYSLGFWKYLLF